MRHATAIAILTVLAAQLAACASGPSLPPTHYRDRLRAVIQQDVGDRETRDEHSRVLAEAVEGGAIEDMTQPEVRAALGPGINCEARDLCADNSFLGTDWYYEIGHMTDEKKVKQMPVLIVGFDHKGTVVRTWTLTTH